MTRYTIRVIKKPAYNVVVLDSSGAYVGGGVTRWSETDARDEVRRQLSMLPSNTGESVEVAFDSLDLTDRGMD